MKLTSILFLITIGAIVMMASCSQEDSSPEPIDVPPFKAFIVGSSEKYQTQYKINFTAFVDGYPGGMHIASRRWPATNFTGLEAFQFQYDEQKRVTSISRELTRWYHKSYQTTTLNHDGDRIVGGQMIGDDHSCFYEFEYHTSGLLNRFDNGVKEMKFDYDGVGNIDGIHFDDLNSSVPFRAFANYDDNPSPFGNVLKLPQPVLVMLLHKLKYIDDDLLVASMLSSNNLQFDSNTYDDEGRPLTIGDFIRFEY